MLYNPLQNAETEQSSSQMTSLLIEKFNDLNITIYGTYEDPLFKAKDIGELLGIKNIKDTINGIDEQYKLLVKAPVGNTDRCLEQLFLTEYGLYEILCISRKPIAKQFKSWVFNVIKEIRLKGKYEIEEKLKEKELELSKYKKTYEDIEKNECVYVIKTDGGYKIGKTKEISKRIRCLQTGNVNDIEIILEFKTSNADLLEKCVHYLLDRYRCNSNREFFDCNIEYIKTVVITVGNTFDTFKSCYENISTDELYDRLNNNLGTSYRGVVNINIQDDNPPEYDYESDFEKWLSYNIDYEQFSVLPLKKIVETYLDDQNLSPKVLCYYRIKIETYLKKKYPNLDKSVYGYKDSSFRGNRYRGWIGFKLNENT